MMVQDIYRNDPWKMMVACIMLNRTTGRKVKEVMRGFFKRFWNPSKVWTSDEEKIAEPLASLGLQNRKAKMIRDFSGEWIGLTQSQKKKIMQGEADLLKDMTGIGDYALESFHVFYRRLIGYCAKDKEVADYIERVTPASELVEKTREYVDLAGEQGELADGRKVLEILNYGYTFNDDFFCSPQDREENDYVLKKLKVNWNEIKRVKRILKDDPMSRQAVIAFSQAQPLPNCYVSAQFQVRRDKLYCSVFQRSQDVEMIRKDTDVLSRMSCMICEAVDVDGYEVVVSVGNMHRYTEDC